MPLIKFISHDGKTDEVHVTEGTTVMHAAVDNNIEGIIAECGGACSCATCHCYVDEEWLPKLAEPSTIEKEMIECVLDPQPNSRLSCQIVMDDSLNGLTVRLPENQF